MTKEQQPPQKELKDHSLEWLMFLDGMLTAEEQDGVDVTDAREELWEAINSKDDS